MEAWETGDQLAVPEPVSPAAWEKSDSLASRPARGMLEAIQAGSQISTLGLYSRGARPTLIPNPNAPWWERAAAGLTQMGGDIPAMVGGGIIGGGIGALTGAAAGGLTGVGAAPGAFAGRVLGTGAGTMAAPPLIRQILLDNIDGKPHDYHQLTQDLLTNGLIGGTMLGGAGVAEQQLARWLGPVTMTEFKTVIGVGGASAAAAWLSATAATASASGHLPTAQEFMDNAVLIFGPFLAARGAQALTRLYAETGTRPTVARKLTETDPTLAQRLLDDYEGARKEPSFQKDVTTAGDLFEARKEPQLEPGKAQPVEKPIEPTPLKTDANKPDAPVAEAPAPVPVGPTRPLPGWEQRAKITNSDEAAALLRQTATEFDAEVQAQRRGVVSDEQALANAQRVVESGQWLRDTLGSDKVGHLMVNDTAILAGKMHLEAAANEALALAKEAAKEGATPEQIAQALAAKERLGALTAAVLGQHAEAGRATRAIGTAAGSVRRATAILEAINDAHASGKRGRENLAALASMTPKEVVASSWRKAGTLEDLALLRKVGLLTSPMTLLVNGIGNAYMLAKRITYNPIASGFGYLMRAGTESGSQSRFGESVASMWAIMSSLPEAGRDAAAAFKESGKLEAGQLVQRTPIGKAAETVGKYLFLGPVDQFFRTLNTRASLAEQAYRQAVDEGYGRISQDALQARMGELILDPTPAMLREAVREGERGTFTAKLTGYGVYLEKLMRAPLAQLVAPFVRTPIHLYAEAVRMSPLAPFIKSWREDFMAGGARRDKAMAEVVIGHAMILKTIAAVDAGTLTGAGPRDPKKRAALMAAGWKPNSKLIDGVYRDYSRYDPVATLVGTVASMREASNDLTPDEQNRMYDRIIIPMLAMIRAGEGKTWIGGAAQFFSAIGDKNAMAKWLDSTAGSIVPSGVKFGGQLTSQYLQGDLGLHEINNALDAVQDRIPFWRDHDMLPKRDAFGEHITRPADAWLNPSAGTPVSDDPVRIEAGRLGVSLGSAPRELPSPVPGRVTHIQLSDLERNRYGMYGGQAFYAFVERTIALSQYKDGGDELRRLMLSKAAAVSNAYATALARGEHGREIKELATEDAMKLRATRDVNAIKSDTFLNMVLP